MYHDYKCHDEYNAYITHIYKLDLVSFIYQIAFLICFIASHKAVIGFISYIDVDKTLQSSIMFSVQPVRPFQNCSKCNP